MEQSKVNKSFVVFSLMLIALGGLYFIFGVNGASTDTSKTVVSRMDAESISDVMVRCKTIPYPAKVHWKKEMVDAFCEDIFTPTLLPDDVYKLIEAGKGLELDKKYDHILSGYLGGEIPEGAMLNAYSNSFGGSSSEKRRRIKQWLKASPKSPHALTARGMVNRISAWQHRGGEFLRNTPDDQIKKMKAKVDLAIKDLKAAIAINPNQIPAYNELFSVSKLIGDRALAEEYLDKLRAVDPYNYYGLYQYASHLEPRWGGSLAEMNRFANDSQRMADKNPRMVNLLAWYKFYPAISLYRNKKYSESILIFEEAFKEGPLLELMNIYSYSAGMTSNHEKSIEVNSELIRFNPNDAFAYVSRANSYINLSLNDLARRDLNRARIGSPNYTPAISFEISLDLKENKIKDAQRKLIDLLNIDETNEWALENIIWLSIAKTQDEKLGRKMVAKALKVNPNNSVFWWLNWEIERRTNGDVVYATKMFVEKANRNDPRQVKALKYAK